MHSRNIFKDVLWILKGKWENNYLFKMLLHTINNMHTQGLNFIKILFYILQIFSVSAKHCLKYRNIIVEYFKRIVYSLYIFLWWPELFNKAT